MLYASVKRFHVMDGKGNILGWDEEVKKAYASRAVAARSLL
jgi:hypothetical protein